MCVYVCVLKNIHIIIMTSYDISSSFNSSSHLVKTQSDLKEYANFLEKVKSFKFLDVINDGENLKAMNNDNDLIITTLNRKFRVEEVDRVYFLDIEPKIPSDIWYNFNLYCRLKGDIPVYVYIHFKRDQRSTRYVSWYTYDPNAFIPELLSDMGVITSRSKEPILYLFIQDGILYYKSRFKGYKRILRKNFT